MGCPGQPAYTICRPWFYVFTPFFIRMFRIFKGWTHTVTETSLNNFSLILDKGPSINNVSLEREGGKKQKWNFGKTFKVKTEAVRVYSRPKKSSVRGPRVEARNFTTTLLQFDVFFYPTTIWQQAWKAFQPQSANQVILQCNGNIEVSDSGSFFLKKLSFWFQNQILY